MPMCVAEFLAGLKFKELPNGLLLAPIFQIEPEKANLLAKLVKENILYSIE